MKLIVVRHGETAENVKGIILGHKPGKLTETGKGQARKLALRLKDENIDLIFSSDLQRAKDTTKEIVRFHKAPIHYTSELRERCAGIFEGKLREELHKAQDESGFPQGFKPEGGESVIELRERAQKFLNKLFKKYKDKTILLSAHGGFNKVLLTILLKMPVEEALKMDQANCCVNIVEIGDTLEHKVHAINCIKRI